MDATTPHPKSSRLGTCRGGGVGAHEGALELRVTTGRPVPAWFARRPHLVHLASQLLLGSLLSAFTVYYVRGAASPRAALFVGLLVALLVANELVEAPLRVLSARMALLAFCQFNGLLFVLPVVTRRLVPVWQVAALTIAAVAAVLLLARAGAELRSFVRGVAPGALTLAAVQGLVWAQVLPPLPLSLHRVGVFHDVVRTGDGYALTWEREPIFGRAFWRYDRVFHRQGEEAVWCFTALFAPRGMALQVVHLWERLGSTGWEPADRMVLDVEGGRAEGFRTYSRKQNVATGAWRVRIELPTGRELGRVGFEVVDGPPEHPLVTEVL